MPRAIVFRAPPNPHRLLDRIKRRIRANMRIATPHLLSETRPRFRQPRRKPAGGLRRLTAQERREAGDWAHWKTLPDFIPPDLPSESPDEQAP